MQKPNMTATGAALAGKTAFAAWSTDDVDPSEIENE
jgi:hypothetical protein